jgi:hypothetical protein
MGNNGIIRCPEKFQFGSKTMAWAGFTIGPYSVKPDTEILSLGSAGSGFYSLWFLNQRREQSCLIKLLRSNDFNFKELTFFVL